MSGEEIHMRKTSFRAFAALGATLLLATFAGCAKSTDTPTPKAEPTAYYLSYSGAVSDGGVTTWGWSNSELGIAPLAGKALTDAEVTYAFDANFVTNLTNAGADWESYDMTTDAYAWLFEFKDTSVPAANTWYTAKFSTDAANAAYTTPIASGLGMKFWDQSNTAAAWVYVKKIVLTYGDATTETITFTDTTGATIHSVTSAGAATDPAVASRLGFKLTDNCVSAVRGIKTVSF
jgi:hypothetical protein